jgi:phage terminase small subunit
MAPNPRQKRFAQEFVVDLNATAAYQRAGYKAKGHAAAQAASRLLKNVDVQEAIAKAQGEALRAAAASGTEITPKRVLEELARVAFSDLRALFDEQGNLKSVHEWSPEAAATVNSVKIEQFWEGTGEDRISKGQTVEIKRWDKVAALDRLARHLGLLKEVHEHRGTIDVHHTQQLADLTDAQLDQLELERFGRRALPAPNPEGEMPAPR